MSDLELLRNAIETLGAIRVPVGLIESIGVPIFQVRKNLSSLLEAVIANSQKNEEQEPEQEQTEE